jgi:DNA-binding CsgD family transcriptional regulator
LIALLDLAPVALLLLTPAGRLVHANGQALALLDGAAMLRVEDDVLRMRRAEEDAAFRHAVAGLAVIRPTATICLRSREGFAVGILDLRLVVGSGLVAVRIIDLPPGAGVQANRLVTAFGLTPAEARVAAAFLAGLSLQVIATQHSVEVGTVRMQIKRVRAKAGAFSQVHLALLLERAALGFHEVWPPAEIAAGE